jgi:DNA-binding MarR family transcriptional regulator
MRFMGNTKTYLHGCLYFTANSLARNITRMAEEEFRITGLSPAHAFLMMMVNENPGIGPKELACELKIAPSTVTRFLDVLENRGFVKREIEGKISKITPTQKGENLQQIIADSWKSLYNRYSGLLGKTKSENLTKEIYLACSKLNP